MTKDTSQKLTKKPQKCGKKGDVQTIFLLDVFILGADVANLGGVT